MKLESLLKYFEFNSSEFSIRPFDLTDDSLIVKETGIDRIRLSKILISKEFIELLINRIPKTITKIEVPREYIEYLSNFPNLKELNISSYGFISDEHFKYIYDFTSIRKINMVLYSFGYDSLRKKEGYALVSGTNNIIAYKDLVAVNKADVPSDFIQINTKSINKEQLERIYTYVNNGVNRITINTCTSMYRIEFNSEDTVNIKVDGNVEELYKLYEYLYKKYKVLDMYIDINDINNVNMNLLKNLYNTNIPLLIGYDLYSSVSYDEFVSLMSSIKYYRELINDYDLSNIEKVMYAYDIMKTFQYKESEEPDISRNPHKIIETGNIVCVGYSELFKLIINGLDDGLSVLGVSLSGIDKEENEFNHERNIIRIDDDKYNIHGIFALDATWDSIKKDPNNILGSDYTALDLYRFFLIPIKKDEYNKSFPNESEPYIFNSYGSKFFGYERLFNDEVTKEKLSKYLNSDRPSLEDFISMLTNVRLSQGFSKEDIDKEIKKVIEKNNIYLSRDDNEDTFFKSR